MFSYFTGAIITEPWLDIIKKFQHEKLKYKGQLDELFVNYSRLKINKNSPIFTRFMTLTAYLQLNFKEIDPFVLDYIRPVLYGMV